jgi:hypothetical protein
MHTTTKHIDYAKRQRLIKRIAIGVFLFSLITNRLIGWPWIWWYHDWEVGLFEHSLRMQQLPDDADIVASTARFGLLWANSNHCDAQVVEMVASSANPVTFYSYFRDKINLAMPFSEPATYVNVFMLDGDALYHFMEGQVYPVYTTEWGYTYSTAPYAFFLDLYGLDFVTEWVQDIPQRVDKRYYVIEVIDTIHHGFDMTDIRCH